MEENKSINGEEASILLQNSIEMIFNTLKDRSVDSFLIEDYRSAFDELAELTTQPDEVSIEAFTIDEVCAEWIIPANFIPERVILYFHGGAYINGSLKTDRKLASMLANISHTKVLQIAYRVAPEHSFPTAIYDGVASYQWLISHNYKPSQIALAGSSAGGGIVLAVLQLLRDQGLGLPPVVACLSPWVDLTPQGINTNKSVEQDIIFNSKLLNYAASYYPGSEQVSSPLASPLYADLHNLPPVFIQVGQKDVFFDDACQLAKRLKEHHCTAPCVVWENMFPGWHAFADKLLEGRLALEQVAAYFDKYFELSKSTS